MRKRQLVKLAAVPIFLGLALGSASMAAEVQPAAVVAERYASCAAYYLMISKADPRLQKLANVGMVAADNASRLSNPEDALSMMSVATKQMLADMDYDWGNAGVVIGQKADFCKTLMTVSN